MHLYIEPLNGSIDVTSFFRRMQFTTQNIAFLFWFVVSVKLQTRLAGLTKDASVIRDLPQMSS